MSKVKDALLTSVLNMYYDGAPIWDIAAELDITEAQVVDILGLE